MSDDTFKILLATLSLSGGVIGACLKGFWDRQGEKKKPKTELRAKAYEDFILQVISDPRHENKNSFMEVRAKLMVYGETKVLMALSEYYKVQNPDLHDLHPVIIAMRKSLLTGNKSKAQQALTELLEYEENA